MRPKQLSIHNFKRNLERAKELVKISKLSKRDKELILKYEEQLLLEEISMPRRLKVISVLRMFCLKYLKKDFEKATKDDLKKAVIQIEQNEEYSPWTVSTYKGIVKKFYKFLEYGDAYKEQDIYPDKVRWINAGLKTKNKPRINASDILTEEEVKKLIDAATTVRDKCFVAMLYELGSRMSEIGNLRLKDITKDKYGYLIDLKGKTGHRTPRVIFADPYLSLWINEHPLRNDPDAPLWVVIGDKNRLNNPLNYGGLRKIIQTVVGRAGIKKRVYPHLFRHTRVTHLMSTGKINEAQAKVYFGWTPSSTMLSEYAHLVSQDVNEAILGIYGIVKEEKEVHTLTTRACYRCKKLNKPDDIFCPQCGAILDEKTSFELEEANQVADLIIGEHIKRGYKDINRTVAEVLQEIIKKR